MRLTELPPFTPPSLSRAWQSAPHPTLPLIATAFSDKSVRVYSLSNQQLHSTLEGGHKRSVRSVAWKPNLQDGALSLVTGSFDATAGIWRRNAKTEEDDNLVGNDGDDEETDPSDWEFSLVLEGHDSEIKCVGFSPSGQYLATCSRDKSVWIWEEIGAEGEDEWETVAVLQEHEGDVKTVSWCADQGTEGGELLASASYDDTVRLWREDEEGEWGCVSVLKGHEGTVWGLDWEPLTKNDKGDVESEVISMKPARLLTSSADSTIRVWRKLPRVSHGTYAESNGIPSTMRPIGTGEQWVCEAVLPKVHDRAIYSISWSKKTRRVVSTGSDSRVVIYEERPKGPAVADANNIDGAVEVESDMQGLGGAGSETEWHVLCTLDQGHGPFEINHVTWCPRFDGGRKGDEEMVVTTGDDGQVHAWKLEE